jgi:hypothetical protein
MVDSLLFEHCYFLLTREERILYAVVYSLSILISLSYFLDGRGSYWGAMI